MDQGADDEIPGPLRALIHADDDPFRDDGPTVAQTLASEWRRKHPDPVADGITRGIQSLFGVPADPELEEESEAERWTRRQLRELRAKEQRARVEAVWARKWPYERPDDHRSREIQGLFGRSSSGMMARLRRVPMGVDPLLYLQHVGVPSLDWRPEELLAAGAAHRPPSLASHRRRTILKARPDRFPQDPAALRLDLDAVDEMIRRIHRRPVRTLWNRLWVLEARRAGLTMYRAVKGWD